MVPLVRDWELTDYLGLGNAFATVVARLLINYINYRCDSANMYCNANVKYFSLKFERSDWANWKVQGWRCACLELQMPMYND